ncbi:hypothetical protein F4804DRAFT_161011 [Jackrogersella minutella]|nr:hypothetical protein F4804DRAFT_161011 [Jackrogersella minutella]
MDGFKVIERDFSRKGNVLRMVVVLGGLYMAVCYNLATRSTTCFLFKEGSTTTMKKMTTYLKQNKTLFQVKCSLPLSLADMAITTVLNLLMVTKPHFYRFDRNILLEREKFRTHLRLAQLHLDFITDIVNYLRNQLDASAQVDSKTLPQDFQKAMAA